nr:helix-turn-helix domain-containing protein [Rhodothermaceae bacterium]
MDKLYPQDHLLKQFIDYYWVIDRNNPVVKYGHTIFDFPSLSPELVIGLNGSFTITYKGASKVIRESTVFAFIDDKISIDISSVKQLIVVRFRSLGLAAFMPFALSDVNRLRQHAIVPAQPIMSPSLAHLEKHLDFANPPNLVDQLDAWFKKQYQCNKGDFLSDLSAEINPLMSVRHLSTLTGLSYSTLERRFKQESALSPKQFLMLNRFRLAVEAIPSASETDWFDLVVNFGYYDQNHFI